MQSHGYTELCQIWHQASHNRPPLSHVDSYMFAFTLGCDCRRTSGVNVIFNEAINQEKLKDFIGSVD